MNKDKWSFAYVCMLIFFSCINILIYFNILPFDIWRLGNNVMLIITIIMLIRRKTIKEKDMKMTVVGFCAVFIWVITLFTDLFKHIL